MNKFTRRGIVMAIAAMGTVFGSASALAQDYPNRTIKLVVPFAPGGGGDVIGRFYAQKLSENLKVSVIVENKPGASTVIATDLVAKSAPDGYTLLLNVPLLVQTSFLFKKLPYDPLADLTPVAELNRSPLWFAVSTAKTNATTFKEYVEKAKANPNDYNFASIGMGSSGHILGQSLSNTNKLGVMHVAYKGSSPAIMALIGGEVSAVLLDYVTLKPQMSSGKVKLLASTGKNRSRLTPDVPTLSELGYTGFESEVWAGIFVPSKTPKAIVDMLANETKKILAQPETVAKWLELGYEAGNKNSEQFTAEVKKDSELWGSMIKSSGVQLDY